MLCNEYMRLTPKEKRDYIGELIHAVQSDVEYFEKGLEIILLAYNKGLFDGVTINPILEPKNQDPIL